MLGEAAPLGLEHLLGAVLPLRRSRDWSHPTSLRSCRAAVSLA